MERIPTERFVAGCAVAGLAATAACIFLRRIAVAVLIDMPAGEAAAYTAAFSFAAFFAVRSLVRGGSLRLRGIEFAAALLLATPFAAGLTVDPLAILCCLLASGATLGLVGFSELQRDVTVRGAAPKDSRTEAAASAAEPQRSEVAGPIAVPGVPPDTGAAPPEGENVRIVREVRDGRDVIDGVMRFEVPPGETVQVLHVPVWPPLPGDPVVTCELDEIDGRVRVPLAKPHGFRIEVRIPDAIDEPLAGAVRFVARCPVKAA